MSRTRSRRRCPTGKRRYRDGDEAGLALRSLRGRAARADLDGATHSIRVCRKCECPLCAGWHLTSQPDLSWVA